MDRRHFLRCAAATGLALPLAAAAQSASRPRRVAIVGGGFAGATAAKYLRLIDPGIEVVLVERRRDYAACPFGNLTLAGIVDPAQLRVDYSRLQSAYGIRVVHDEVTAIDVAARRLTLRGATLDYERAIVCPGIDFRVEEIEGYNAAQTPGLVPHAWQGGEQYALLRRQLVDMKNGGLVVIAIPQAAYRCPPGPYERACQIAWYLKQHKPRSKLIVLDANADIQSKGALFRAAWKGHYEGMLEYRPGHRVVRVDGPQRIADVEFEALRADVLNLIPPQKAGALAHAAGLVGEDRRWCPVDPTTFESTRAPNVHVIGDAADAGALPKSAFAANAQAKAAAHNIAALLNGRTPTAPSFINACYSFVTDREAISVAAVYRLDQGRIAAVPQSGGVSAQASDTEAEHARSWFRNIMNDSFA